LRKQPLPLLFVPKLDQNRRKKQGLVKCLNNTPRMTTSNRCLARLQAAGKFLDHPRSADPTHRVTSGYKLAFSISSRLRISSSFCLRPSRLRFSVSARRPDSLFSRVVNICSCLVIISTSPLRLHLKPAPQYQFYCATPAISFRRWCRAKPYQYKLPCLSARSGVRGPRIAT